MESHLHALDSGLALLMTYLMSQGNVSQPSLAIGQGGMQEGVH